MRFLHLRILPLEVLDIFCSNNFTIQPYYYIHHPFLPENVLRLLSLKYYVLIQSQPYF